MIRRYFWMKGMLFLASVAGAQITVPCPAPPVQVQPQVQVTVSFDTATNLHVYTYTVANGAGANQAISDLAIDFASATSSVQSPFGWSHGTFKKRNTVHWAATLVVDEPNDVDDGSIPPGVAQIQPGTSTTGFSFESLNPPGPVRFFVLGYVKVLFETEANAEDALTDCPASVGDFFQVSLVGTTTGPVDFVPITIAIKPMAAAPLPINPREQGVTPVAILSTSTFDAGTIDPASLSFGPGGATPAKGKAHLEDVNGDGLSRSGGAVPLATNRGTVQRHRAIPDRNNVRGKCGSGVRNDTDSWL